MAKRPDQFPTATAGQKVVHAVNKNDLTDGPNGTSQSVAVVERGETTEEVTLGQFISTVDQNPTGAGHDNRIKMTFGAGGNTSGGEFTVGADGIVTCNMNSQQYALTFVGRLGRTGGAGNALVFARLMYAADGIEANAVQLGNTFSALLDNANAYFPFTFTLDTSPAVGSIIFVEIARDESENDSGGLTVSQPTGSLDANGWNNSASASITISKEVV